MPALAVGENRNDLVITAVGEVRITSRQLQRNRKELGEIHLQGNLVFANFEGTVGVANPADPWLFSAPPESIGALHSMGLSVVALENNHVRDLGESAFQRTVNDLRDQGIFVATDARSGVPLKLSGHHVRLFAYSFSSPQNNVNDLRSIPDSFPRNPGEIVVVSAHMGREDRRAHLVDGGMEYFGNEKRGDVVAFSHGCIDAGADLVLGHGPHAPRGLELYKGKLIVYSLGNFAFDYPGAELHPHAPGYSISVRLDPKGNFRNAQIVSYDLRDGVPVPDRSGRAYQMIRDLTLQNLKQSALAFPGKGRVERTGRER